ncbi:7795_t:CDS:1, partial [Dentiscutata erythropus]
KLFDRIEINIAGSLSITSQNNRYIVVAMEYLTKWLEARVLEKADTENVTAFTLKNIIF